MIHKFKHNDLCIVHDVNSGAVHIVDDLVLDLLDSYPTKSKEETKTLLKNKYQDTEMDQALEELDRLIASGQLFSDDTYLDNHAFKMKKHVIKAMCLHVAHDCNIRCRYCFASQGDFEGDRSLMSLETGKKALKFLVDHSGNRRNLEVDFFGGEPLMNFDVVKELVTYGNEMAGEANKEFRFTLTTNGVLLNDEIIDYVNEHMHNVVLSIDGRQKVNDFMRYTINEKGTYETIVPKFKKLVDGRGDKSYYVRGTFTRYNLDFSKDVVHLADLGFKNTSVEPVVAEPHHDYALREEDLETLKKQYEDLAEVMLERYHTEKAFNFFHFTIDLNQGPCVIKRLVGCGAGAEYVAVTPEGDIYPCHQFVGNEDFKMGSVLNPEAIEKPDIVASFSEAHVYNKPTCKECWARFYCSGGCHANAYNFNNDILQPYTVGCELEKKRIECSLYIQAKLMLGESND